MREFQIEELPIGAVFPYLVDQTCPEGCVIANGAFVNCDTYPKLTALLEKVREAAATNDWATPVLNKTGERRGNEIRLPDFSEVSLEEGLGEEFGIVDNSRLLWLIKVSAD